MRSLWEALWHLQAMGKLGLTLWEFRFSEQKNTHHRGCETLLEKFDPNC